MAKLTTEEFIAKAKAVHGDRYDYSKVEYVDLKTKVCLICKNHGEFLQNPYSHLNGHGCSKCAYEEKKQKHKYDQDEIIEKLRVKFGCRYSYEKVKYKAMKVPITLICHEKDVNGIEHGEFSIRPDNVFSGKQGCPKCYNDKRSMLQRMPIEKFIEEANKVHGNLYEYHKVDYINGKTKVCIVCPIHGDYWQTPSNHLKGQGCPYCSGNARKWNEETCEQEARKYEYIFDFRIKSGGACNVAERNGWLRNYTWLKKLPPKTADYNKNTKYIYAYEFIEQKAVYVGLTNSMIKRDWQHRNNKKSSVYRFAEKSGCEIPTPKILEDNLPIYNSGERENYWVITYKKDAWSLLNRAKTGERESSVGIYYPIKWNKKSIREKAKECNYNLKIFMERYKGAYEAILSRYKGLLNELFPQRYKHTHHTIEEALLVVQKGNYKNRMHLHNECLWAYRVLSQNEILDDVFGKPKEYSKEEALRESLNYKSIEQIRRTNHPLWNYLRKNNLFREAKPTDAMFHRVNTVEEAWDLSQYYKNKTELSNHAKLAYRMLKEHGLLEKRYPLSSRIGNEKEELEEYDFEYFKDIYKQCKFVYEVEKRFHKVYKIAKEKGWHDKLKCYCYGKPQKKKSQEIVTRKWTKDACKEIVEKYTFLKDLINNESNIYQTIKRNHWDDLLLPLKRVLHTPYKFTIEEIKAICAPYNSLQELSKARKDIENYCRNRGINLYDLNGWKDLRIRKISQILDGKEIAIYPSITAAAKSINVPRNRMWEHIQDGQPYKGYIWKYKEE